MDRRVSIIIVSHDLRDYLLKCISAIDNYTERGLIEEIVLVDNGSPHEIGEEEIAAVTSIRTVLVPLKENSSYSLANNRGVSASGGGMCVS
ncbi:MAG: glycosyltransferase [Thermodesulfobacteriota bacterium]|nr:glycosyltransferase [Thermodesulfobacteriota bacterium]